MKAAFPLSWKILLVALANVVVLATIAAAFVQYELGREFTSMLLGPGGDRALAIARQLALDLSDTTAGDRDALLDRYRREHGVTFLLFDNSGEMLAGPALDVPPAVMDRITSGGPGLPPGVLGPGREAPARADADRRRPPPLPPGPPFLVTTDGPVKYWTGVRIPVRARDRDVTVRGTLILASDTLLSNPMYVQPLPWLAVIGVTLGVTAACWIPLVRGVTRSVADMTRATG